MEEPKYLFILTPPYSGSTVLSRILNSSPYSMILHHKGEGQWLVPDEFHKGNWSENAKINWGLVKKVWDKKFNDVNTLVSSLHVVIEKSPLNISYVKDLQENFPGSSYFVFNRNPYAHISSVYFRMLKRQQNRDGKTAGNWKTRIKMILPSLLKKGTQKKHSKDEKKVMANLANLWIKRSEYLMKAIEELQCPHFTYEYFCDNTEAAVQTVQQICPELKDIQTEIKVQVKDYPEQGIVNQNERQISKLSEDAIKAITGKLSERKDILDFFGYTLL